MWINWTRCESFPIKSVLGTQIILLIYVMSYSQKYVCFSSCYIESFSETRKGVLLNEMYYYYNAAPLRLCKTTSAWNFNQNIFRHNDQRLKLYFITFGRIKLEYKLEIKKENIKVRSRRRFASHVINTSKSKPLKIIILIIITMILISTQVFCFKKIKNVYMNKT